MLEGVAVQSDGTILLAGDTTGSWSGSNAGSSEEDPTKDFAAVMLAPDGTELWRYQVGGQAETLSAAAEFLVFSLTHTHQESPRQNEQGTLPLIPLSA